jgi:hypothetical protein
MEVVTPGKLLSQMVIVGFLVPCLLACYPRPHEYTRVPEPHAIHGNWRSPLSSATSVRSHVKKC